MGALWALRRPERISEVTAELIRNPNEALLLQALLLDLPAIR
jgi:hypothetical protein